MECDVTAHALQTRASPIKRPVSVIETEYGLFPNTCYFRPAELAGRAFEVILQDSETLAFDDRLFTMRTIGVFEGCAGDITYINVFHASFYCNVTCLFKDGFRSIGKICQFVLWEKA